MAGGWTHRQHEFQWNLLSDKNGSVKGPYQNTQTWCLLFHLFLTLTISIIHCILKKGNPFSVKLRWAAITLQRCKKVLSTCVHLELQLQNEQEQKTHLPSKCFNLFAIRWFHQLFLNSKHCSVNPEVLFTETRELSYRTSWLWSLKWCFYLYCMLKLLMLPL